MKEALTLKKKAGDEWLTAQAEKETACPLPHVHLCDALKCFLRF